MNVSGSIARMARRFGTRPALVYATLIGFLLLTALLLARTTVGEDVTTLLPDDGSGLTEDFALLRHAPVLSRMLITLTAREDAARDLPRTARRLGSALQGDFFRKVASGPSRKLGPDIIRWMVRHAAVLLDPASYPDLRERTDAAAVAEALRKDYDELLAPGGIAFKRIVREDPLRLRELLLPRMQSLAVAPGVTIAEGVFLSRDKRHALIVAEPRAAFTDSASAERLLAFVDRTLRGTLPPGITATVTGGHRHTAANARTIKSDLVIVMSASVLLLAAIFFGCIRRGRALCAFVVPGLAFGAAVAGTGLAFPTLSGIVIGFGAVLIGISVDFAVHVFMATSGPDPEGGLERSVRPLLFCALTSMGAFAVLLFSSIPGIRQLAVFSLVGLGASLLLSIFILPRFTAAHGAASAPATGVSAPPIPRKRVLTIICWLLFLGLTAFAARDVRVRGDLRELSYRDPAVMRAETLVRDIWGLDGGGQLVFTPPAPLGEALRTNDRIFATLSKSGERVLSAAPLLPSSATQRARLAAWQAFWTSERIHALRDDIKREAARLGFRSTAFAPFFETLARPPLLAPDDAREAGLGDLLDMLVFKTPEGWRVLSVHPGDMDPATAAELAAEGARVVSMRNVRGEIETAVRGDVLRFLALSIGAVLVLLAVLFRNARDVGLAAAPVLTGIMAVLGGAALGQGMNIFTITAFPMVAGLSADYGIYMAHRMRGLVGAETVRATWVSGLTTLAGFGVLILARHPALHAIGVAVGYGIGAALPTALWVVPALDAGRRT